MVEHAVILAGGAGTRLWPASTNEHPKQFLRFTEGQSLFTMTLRRAFGLGIEGTICIVTHRDHAQSIVEECAEVLKDAGFPPERILILAEPEGKNTAPAIAYACTVLRGLGSPEDTLVVMPADHTIEPLPVFIADVSKAARLAELARAGFTVPEGFCLTTAAFRQFMDACPDAETIYHKLDTVAAGDVETVRSVGQRIRRQLLDVPIPQKIARAVRRAWQDAGTERAYAVRSSATAEDLPDASFAGQQDTYLNITVISKFINKQIYFIFFIFLSFSFIRIFVNPFSQGCIKQGRNFAFVRKSENSFYYPRKEPVSNEKIEATGFKPDYNLQQGIEELIKGYKVLRPNIFSNQC